MPFHALGRFDGKRQPAIRTIHRTRNLRAAGGTGSGEGLVFFLRDAKVDHEETQSIDEILILDDHVVFRDASEVGDPRGHSLQLEGDTFASQQMGDALDLGLGKTGNFFHGEGLRESSVREGQGSTSKPVARTSCGIRSSENIIGNMKKQLVFQALREALEARLRSSLSGFGDAADYATSEEAKADSKYDTQGLEASYLAAGQAASAGEIGAGIERLIALEAEFLVPKQEVSSGALVSCRIEGMAEWFLLSPVGGGETLEGEGRAIDVVSPSSRLGRSLLGKSTGRVVRLPSGSIGFVESVE